MLCLGSFLRCIIECRANSKVLNKHVVGALMSIFDSEFNSEDNSIVSNLVIARKNPSAYIMGQVHSMESDYLYIKERIEKGLMLLINPNMNDRLIKAISILIIEDENIFDDTVVEVITGTKKEQLCGKVVDISSFLAGVFIYTIRYTDNETSISTKEIVKDVFERVDTYVFKEIEEIKNDSVNLSGIDFSKVMLFKKDKFTPIAIAAILGSWDEENAYDIEFIEELTGMKYVDCMEDIKICVGDIVDYHNHKCNITCFFELRNQIIKEINIDTLNGLVQVLAKRLLKTSFCLFPSDESIRGIFDCLAYWGNNITKSKRISLFEWRNIIYEFENSIIEKGNETQIAIFIRNSDIIVEADINSFLDIIETQVENNNSQINTLIKDDNNGIAYQLSVSLSKSASQKNTFSKAMYIMFLLIKYSDIFEKAIVNVLYPKYSQTNATDEQVKGLIKRFFKDNYDTAWNLVYNIIFENIGDKLYLNDLKYLPQKDYRADEEVYTKICNFYISCLCDYKYFSTSKIIKLIKLIPYLSEEYANEIIDAIINSEVKNIDGEKLWKQIKWTIDVLERNKIVLKKFEQILEKYKDNKEKYDILELFSYRYFQKNNNDLLSRAQTYIKQIKKTNGISGIYEYGTLAEDKNFYFNVVASVLSKTESEELIEICSDKKENVANIFINELKDDVILDYIEDKLSEKTIKLLCMHSATKNIFEYIKTLKEPYKKIYWKNVSILGIRNIKKEDIKYFINMLFKYKNYDTVIQTLYIVNDGLDEVFPNKDCIYKSLELYEFVYNDEMRKDSAIKYCVQNLIKRLQDKWEKDDSKDRLCCIEEKYISIMGWSEIVRPRFIYSKMLNNPEYVEELLLKAREYRNMGEFNSSSDILLYGFKNNTENKIQDEFNYKIVEKWDRFLRKRTNSILYNDMVEIFGKVLSYVPKDKDGFIINRKVAEYLESKDNKSILLHFEMEIFNHINTINVGPDEPGIKGLIKEYEDKASLCDNEGYISLGNVYRNVADKYMIMLEHS